jgi:hypothetical protein
MQSRVRTVGRLRGWHRMSRLHVTRAKYFLEKSLLHFVIRFKSRASFDTPFYSERRVEDRHRYPSRSVVCSDPIVIPIVKMPETSESRRGRLREAVAEIDQNTLATRLIMALLIEANLANLGRCLPGPRPL